MSPRVTGRVGRGNPADAPAAGLTAESLLFAVTTGSLQDLASDKLGRELSADEVEWVAQQLTLAAGEALDTLVGSLPTTDRPSDYRCQLKAIALFADELIHGEGSTTSIYFDRWVQIRDTAQQLLTLLDQSELEGIDSLAENWARLTSVELQGYYRIDALDDLLARRRQIAHVWSVEDVLEVRPDLDEDQAWSVLQLVDDQKDAQYGISWETLVAAAAQLYSEEGGAS